MTNISTHPLAAEDIASLAGLYANATAPDVQAFLTAHPFLVPLTVPRGTYPGQAEPIATIGSASFIVARPELDEALVHRLTAALHKTERFAGRPAYLAQTTAANTLASVESLDELHPGTLRYFREVGIVP